MKLFSSVKLRQGLRSDPLAFRLPVWRVCPIPWLSGPRRFWLLEIIEAAQGKAYEPELATLASS